MSEEKVANGDTSGSGLPFELLTRYLAYADSFGDEKSYRFRVLLRWFAPLVEHFLDPTISEIFVNRCDNTWVRRRGVDERVSTSMSKEQLEDLIRAIANMNGQLIGEDAAKGESLKVDGRLPDGSRVSAGVPPFRVGGPGLTIRKHLKAFHHEQTLIDYGTVTREALDWIKHHVSLDCNFLVSGGTECGKTTMLNVMMQYLDRERRIITVEDTPELQIEGPQVIALRTVPNAGMTWLEAINYCLRESPAHIVFGEIRGGKTSPAYSFIQALNSGHGGSFCTLHANSRGEALIKYRDYCFDGAGPNVSEHVISRAIGRAFHVIVQLRKVPLPAGGVRKVVDSMCLCNGYDDQRRDYSVTVVFEFDRDSTTGKLKPDGVLRQVQDVNYVAD